MVPLFAALCLCAVSHDRLIVYWHSICCVSVTIFILALPIRRTLERRRIIFFCFLFRTMVPLFAALCLCAVSHDRLIVYWHSICCVSVTIFILALPIRRTLERRRIIFFC